MNQWITYQLDWRDGERGYQPTVQIESAGCTHQLGMMTVGDLYIGTLTGTQEQITAVISACSIYSMTAKTAEEIEVVTSGGLPWGPTRNKRNELIAKQEWKLTSWALTTFTEKEAVLAYIQLLRDIPQSFTTPDAVVWPEKP